MSVVKRKRKESQFEVFHHSSTGNRLDGIITITETGLVLNWVLTGTLTGVTGNRRCLIQAFA